MNFTRMAHFASQVSFVLLLLCAPLHADAELKATLPLEELRMFTDVLDRIHSEHVESVDDRRLLENAVRGMLAELDPHSAYLDAEAFRELQTGTSGEFGGLGIEVGMEDGFIKVIAPIDDTPAQRAGVLAGDLIIRLDDMPVKGMTLDEAVQRMRGRPQSPIELTIVREGEDAPLTITVVRDIIRIRSVRNRLLEPGFGYVRVSQFQSRTGESLLEALTALQAENNGALRGLVLDLRNNPGGVLNAAVEVADIFLDRNGLIVYTEGRNASSRQDFHATSGDALAGASLVVLINEGSASASEIVAGALQDHRRGIIMGARSFGKGSVQTILPLPNGSAIKLTTARYYTPDGRSIQAEGIRPDIELESLELIRREQNGLRQLTEADLPDHLDNGEQTDGTTTNDVVSQDATQNTSLARSDYQLYEALNLLKGLDLVLRSRDTQ